MNRVVFASASIVCCCLLVLAGCGGGTPSSGGGSEYKTYTAEELPGVFDPFPGALDGGRVRVFGPNAWKTAPRSADHVACFYPEGAGREPPRIFVNVDPSPGLSAQNVTLDTLPSFLEAIGARVNQEKKILEPAHAVILAGRPWVRYVQGGVYGRARREVKLQHLVTVYDGRLYEVKLVVYEDKLMESRDDAYAVAARMQFQQPGAETSPEQPAEDLGDALPEIGPGEEEPPLE